ncbi:hydroxyacylglutathione hydrolase [Silvimonas terrae]|uniref:Hydroxyacylglutathione hydrolase n=1 Tax=Silvimonas terrae TaxID=300266 RepID=A0A840RFP8_9NEIS|nr:hydroxyacylglutathione hydrolase [Silvimonas terrae]MBB5191230.1 hydroxyacylglutathione hydrolase [Silvimonas terrae]
MFKITPIPIFDDNYIWLLQQGTDAVAVDPGSAEPLLDYLKAHGLNLVAILATHHHADHVGGLPVLASAAPCPVYGPGSIAGVTNPVTDGDTIRLLDQDFRIIGLPGHTLDHIGYVGAGGVFCGDTLFAAGCGRLFEGTPAQMFHSLSTLAALPQDTQVYCTHEYTLSNLRFARAVEPDSAPLAARILNETAKRETGQPTLPSSIGLELATNPFLRTTEPAVIAAAQNRDPATRQPVGVFAALRRWKDEFRG